MTEEGEIMPLFLDYLLVTQHTLMKEIYEKTFFKKLGLTPQEIRQQYTRAAFDGQYFSLNAPEVLAKMTVERAKGTTATAREKAGLLEWLLCTWDPAHRLELVTNDIRVDRNGVDVELMSVPWYAQTPKDVFAMYACCSYGKQYEELLQIAEHLGRKWYAMVKFCETRFSQSELKLYVNFEKNYNTYRRTWGVEEREEQPHEEERVVEEQLQEQGDSEDDDESVAVLQRRKRIGINSINISGTSSNNSSNNNNNNNSSSSSNNNNSNNNNTSSSNNNNNNNTNNRINNNNNNNISDCLHLQQEQRHQHEYRQQHKRQSSKTHEFFAQGHQEHLLRVPKREELGQQLVELLQRRGQRELLLAP
jgi:hypothetical protein